MSDDALQIWREKLAHFQRELAISADAATKFQLERQIAEAIARIEQLQGTLPQVSSKDASPPPRRSIEVTSTHGSSDTEERQDQHIVLIVHGIRDFGRWQQMVVEVLKSGGIRGIPVKYGYFDVFRFLSPFRHSKRKPIERLKREFSDAQSAYRNARISVIAHSFGTFVTTKVLEEDANLSVWRMIFCGSVVQQDFRWQRIKAQVGDPNDGDKRKYIVNECGSRDIWPVLGKAAGWGYGAAGTDGFGTVLVTDRWHAGGHGLYFDRSFVEDYWLPFLQVGEDRSGGGVQRGDAPFWLKLAGFLPLRLIPFVLLVLAAAIVLYFSGLFQNQGLENGTAPNQSAQSTQTLEVRHADMRTMNGEPYLRPPVRISRSWLSNGCPVVAFSPND